MQLQNGIEKPVIFVSHILSDQATRWGIMELELYAFNGVKLPLLDEGQTFQLSHTYLIESALQD